MSNATADSVPLDCPSRGSRPSAISSSRIVKSWSAAGVTLLRWYSLLSDTLQNVRLFAWCRSVARPPNALSEYTGSAACHACPSNVSEKCGCQIAGCRYSARTPRSSDDHFPSNPACRAPPKKFTWSHLIRARTCSSVP